MKRYTFFVAFFSAGDIELATLQCTSRHDATVAGNHVLGYSGDGYATAAQLNNPNGIAVDASGNIYVADYFNNRIRKVSLTGIITTIAGTGGAGYSGDGGPATGAQLNNPVGLAFDGGGNLYVADANNDRIRKISAAGIISTIAGNGSSGYGGDGGPATVAQLHWPSAVALDGSGNIYVADFSNNRVRKINALGTISTFAGTGATGYSGDGGAATAAKLTLPYGVTVHGSDVYIADYGNNAIREVNSAGIIATTAGTGIAGFSGDGGTATAANLNVPEQIIFDAIGNSYIVDVQNQRIRKINTSGTITTIAGNGTAGYLGNGGIALQAELNSPAAITIDGSNNIYVADFDNNAVRKLQTVPNNISDSFSVFINDYCNGPQIALVPNHYTAGMYVKSYFGDGTVDSSAVLSSGYVSINHNYANSGTYTIKHILHSSTSPIDSYHYSFTHIICNSFSVKFYYDGNSNCTKDITEGYISQPLAFEIDSNGIAIDTVCATSGLYYTAYGAVGTVYGFKPLSTPAGLYISCPPTGIVYDTISATSYIPPVKNVALSCTGSPSFDLSINAITTATGVSDQYGVIYIQNNFCLPINGTVTLHYSPKYGGSPRDMDPAPTSISGNTIVWNLDTLSSTLSSPISINYGVWHSTTLLTIGDTVHSYFTIDPVVGDTNPSNNAQIIIDTVKGGCDPNEMWVLPQCIASGTSANLLQYTINFENTGNDTAHNIYVMDTLPDNTDVSSMRLVLSSHEMYTSRLKDAAGHNIFKFDFPSINLLDSSHHGQCDGAIIFTINSQSGLSNGSQISNRAGIYFDVNPVVMTNTVTTGVGGCTFTSVPIVSKQNYQIYPNPATDELTIKMDKDAYNSVTISNSMGQVMMQEPINNSMTKVDVKVLPAGIYFVTLRGADGSVVEKFVKM